MNELWLNFEDFPNLFKDCVLYKAFTRLSMELRNIIIMFYVANLLLYILIIITNILRSIEISHLR